MDGASSYQGLEWHSDIGQYLENIVYLDLKQRGWQVSVGRLGEWEVDFVAQKSADKCYGQVAYLTPDKETLNRELRPLRDIPDNYPKYLVTMDEIPASSKEGIHRMPVEASFFCVKPVSEVKNFKNGEIWKWMK